MTRGALTTIKLESYKPLRELVFEKLREAIVDGTLPSGERLMEVQLADDLGVSRTPVREAIRRLEMEGFVVMTPRKGAYVSGFSLKDITDVFEIREALEALAASLAAERISEEQITDLYRHLELFEKATVSHDVEEWVKLDTSFHAVIYTASQNERLVQMINNIMEKILRYRKMSLKPEERIKFAYKEHQDIVAALARRDREAARKAASIHINNAHISIVDILNNQYGVGNIHE